MQISRRDWLLASGAFAAALAMGSRTARAADLKTVRFGIGQKAMAPNVINCVIGEVLGYNKEETSRSSRRLWAVTPMCRSRWSAAMSTSGSGCPPLACLCWRRANGGAAINFYQYTYPYKWDIVVKRAPRSRAIRI